MQSQEYPRGYPPKTTSPIVGRIIEWSEFYEPIKALADAVDARIINSDKDAAIRQLILSMLDIDRSMRRILVSCENQEADGGELTGCWLDATILARPQLETLFLILLVLTDEEKYFLWHEQWSAISLCKQVDWQASQYSSPEEFDDLLRHQILLADTACERLGIDDRERKLHVAKAQGACPKDEWRTRRISQFPGPSDVFQQKLLRNSPCHALGDIMYHHYNFLCGPVHASARFAGEKSILRQSISEAESMSSASRRNFIMNRVQPDSILMSSLSIVSACTAIAVSRKSLKNDHTLYRPISNAWNYFERHHAVGKAVYQGWAKTALNIM